MSERHKTHNGRDVDGNFRVKQTDFEDKQTDPDGPDLIRDDVRLGGAVADIGPYAGRHAAEISELVERNREDVDRLVGNARERGRTNNRRKRGER